MLKNIVEFFDTNPIIGIILIFLIGYFLFVGMFNSNSDNKDNNTKNQNSVVNTTITLPVQSANEETAKTNISENMTNMTNIENFEGFTGFGGFDSSIFGNNFATVDMSKTVNLKCKIDDVEYYLANMDVNPELTTKNTNKLPKDCSTSALVLIPVTEINKNLDTYMKSLSTASKLCAFTSKTKCLENITDPTSEDEQKCEKIPESCNYNRYFINDFKVKEIPSKDGSCGPKKYLFFGVRSVPQPGSSAPSSMINHELYYDANPSPIPIVCGDYYPYGARGQTNEWGEMYVSETSQPETGIIGLGSNLKVKLAFKSQVVLPGKDSTGKDIYTPCPSCDPAFRYSYIGYCKDSDNLDYKTADGNSYKRICIIPENLLTTSDGTRVLEFEPVVVA